MLSYIALVVSIGSCTLNLTLLRLTTRQGAELQAKLDELEQWTGK